MKRIYSPEKGVKMYTRSIANKLNLLKILYDNECEDYLEFSELERELCKPNEYVAKAKKLKDHYRRRILLIHLGTLLST